MFTPHLIMGQVFYGTDPWPTWPIHICWAIWPMTHCLLCGFWAAFSLLPCSHVLLSLFVLGIYFGYLRYLSFHIISLLLWQLTSIYQCATATLPVES